LTGASSSDSERSGTDVERVIAEAEKDSAVDFLWSAELMALSSFEANWGATIERLEDPDVETVESDDDD
jgi:hypothetical protein